MLFWEICGTALAHSLARNNTSRWTENEASAPHHRYTHMLQLSRRPAIFSKNKRDTFRFRTTQLKTLLLSRVTHKSFSSYFLPASLHDQTPSPSTLFPARQTRRYFFRDKKVYHPRGKRGGCGVSRRRKFFPSSSARERHQTLLLLALVWGETHWRETEGGRRRKKREGDTRNPLSFRKSALWEKGNDYAVPPITIHIIADHSSIMYSLISVSPFFECNLFSKWAIFSSLSLSARIVRPSPSFPPLMDYPLSSTRNKTPPTPTPTRS